MFLKFGGAETDEQFQSTLERFLVPTILKSSSPYKSVQNKVRCSHSKRLYVWCRLNTLFFKGARDIDAYQQEVAQSSHCAVAYDDTVGSVL